MHALLHIFEKITEIIISSPDLSCFFICVKECIKVYNKHYNSVSVNYLGMHILYVVSYIYNMLEPFQ